jgi:predicted ATPase/DNA-binding CsgD family transcriptional regulator
MDSADRAIPSRSLPTPLTPLIGRDREIAEVATLVRDPVIRLVTLTGPGGVGKTRLAVATAERMRGTFPAGVWFVDLAPVRDPDLVLLVIARTLGLRDASDADAGGWLNDFLRDKNALLVLDNLEQVVAAAPALARFIAGLPALQVLGTSRIRLRITGEQQYPVPPLDSPGREWRLDPTASDHWPAIQLFEQRARAVQPEFHVDADNANAVAEICRRLDGLPLAIELAAARVTMLAPSALRDRLEQRLPVLTGGARDLPERQQTMRNTIAWSFDLLSADEQALLRRLSVLVGDFGFDAAEALGAAEPLVSDGLTALNGLIDQGLIRRIHAPDNEPRFGILETVREYAFERLVAAGEEPGAMTALAAWTASVLELAATGLKDFPRQPVWRSRLDRELANIRLGLDRLLDEGRFGEIVRLLGRTEEYWTQRPYQGQVLGWLEPALASDAEADPHDRAYALILAAYMAGWANQLEKARSFAEEAVALGKTLDDALLQGRSLHNLALTWQYSGDFAATQELLFEAEAHLRQVSNPIWLAFTLTDIADMHLVRGSVESAKPLLDEALSLMERVEYGPGVVYVRGVQGIAALAQGRLTDAAVYFIDGFAVTRASGDERHGQGFAAGLSGVALAAGLLEEAAAMLGSIEAAMIATGVVRLIQNYHIEPIRAELRARLGEDAYREAMRRGSSIPLDQAVADLAGLIQGALGERSTPTTAYPYALTARELDVLRLLAQGKSDREIAEALFIGARTVETHVSNLIAKLGVHNRTEAAALATREGLVDGHR